MIETIEFKGEQYPKFQSNGNAIRFIKAFAEEVCKGVGYDIGSSKWPFPGAHPIDPAIDQNYNAMNLPDGEVDYIISSHCLEHLDRWVDVLDYWYEHIKPGGVLFLYLPHPSQKYWRPHNNRKHIHVFHPSTLKVYLKQKGYKKVFVSKRDLNNSFAVMCEK